MPKKKKELQQFSFSARKVCNLIVTVEAESESAAREIAETGDWLDEQEEGMADWEIRGRVR